MEQNTASRREVWLSIALAVARDGLPEPRGLNLHDQIVSLTLETHDDTRKWADHLGASRCEVNPLDGSLWAPHFVRDGWAWQVKCHEPAAPPSESVLAEEVAAAILAPDAELVAR